MVHCLLVILYPWFTCDTQRTRKYKVYACGGQRFLALNWRSAGYLGCSGPPKLNHNRYSSWGPTTSLSKEKPFPNRKGKLWDIMAFSVVDLRGCLRVGFETHATMVRIACVCMRSQVGSRGIGSKGGLLWACHKVGGWPIGFSSLRRNAKSAEFSPTQTRTQRLRNGCVTPAKRLRLCDERIIRPLGVIWVGRRQIVCEKGSFVEKGGSIFMSARALLCSKLPVSAHNRTRVHSCASCGPSLDGSWFLNAWQEHWYLSPAPRKGAHPCWGYS